MAEKSLSSSELKSNNAGRIILKIVIYIFLTLVALIMIVPFYYMVITSFTLRSAFDDAKASHEALAMLFPLSLTFDNYVQVFQVGAGSGAAMSGFAGFFINTLVVAIISVAVTLITTIFASFAFARLQFKGKNLLFMVILATMMVPGEMMILTNYQTAKSFGWENTFSSLILVHGVAVFYIFYLRQTFQQIPNELYLAAKVDGYSDMQYFRKVMLPLASPTIITILILSMMGTWNSYMWPSLMASGRNTVLAAMGIQWDMRLVSNGLMSLFSGEFGDNIPARLAGTMIVTLPLLIVFACFRKKIMTGVSRSGIKG